MYAARWKSAAIAAVIFLSGSAIAEPGTEEIAEMAQAVSVKRAEFGKAADDAKSKADTSPDWAIAELKRISSELDVLDSEDRKLDRFRTMISEGYGCVEGRCIDGHGKYVTKSGTSYEGAFVSEKRHGFGKFVRSNGEFFSGEWNENRLEGECESGIVGSSSQKGTCSYDSRNRIVFQRYSNAATNAAPPDSSVRHSGKKSESSSSGGWGKWVLIFIAVVVVGAILENFFKNGSGSGGRSTSPSYVRVETGPLSEIERPSRFFAPPPSAVPPPAEPPRRSRPQSQPRASGPTTTPRAPVTGGRNPDHVNAKGIPASGNVTIDT